ncbi:MAG: BolA family transcriptional regulator [Deltaproteobacteria bacterium]|nr:BolA family transcriptional regulator [Deltaproteobacteria bacterium]
MEAQRIEAMIKAAIPDADVRAVDMQGTGDHFDVVVVSAAFAGRSLVQQHRLVYGALGDSMRQAIHALALRTLTPEQFQQELVTDIGAAD